MCYCNEGDILPKFQMTLEVVEVWRGCLADEQSKGLR